jgi:molybdopterin converting factor small subunit
MKVRLLFFAAARELTGLKEVELELDKAATPTSASIPDILTSRWPAIASILPNCVLAVNQEYVDADKHVDLKDGSCFRSLLSDLSVPSSLCPKRPIYLFA